MTTLTAINKKNEEQVTAVELADGRFEVTAGTEVKTIAASTFKRWYKVVQEVQPVAEPVVAEEVAEVAEEVAEPAVELTTNEVALLNGMRTNEFNDAYEDGIGTWTFTAIDYSGLSEKVARGVISSLIKKGLVWVEEPDKAHGDEHSTISFTKAGLALFDNATGEECSWGGPNLLGYDNAKPSNNASELDALLDDAEVVETAQEPVQEPKASEPIQAGVGVTVEELTKDGGKCEKLKTTIQYENSVIEIIEYAGYVCDVTVTTGDNVYKSPKMSIKDALENGLGLSGDAAKAAKKVIVGARKAAKAAIAK